MFFKEWFLNWCLWKKVELERSLGFWEVLVFIGYVEEDKYKWVWEEVFKGEMEDVGSKIFWKFRV